MNKRDISLNIEGLKAEVIYHKYHEFDIKTLLISFRGETRRVLSTLDGYRRVKYVANVYVPNSLAMQTMTNYENFFKEFPDSLGINYNEISFLSTGADMDNLAVYESSYQEFTICCLATGGTGNALRTGIDKADYVERNGKFEHIHGTINIIVLSNVALSDGAMARAIITATEAKTAALQDLGVMSVFSPKCQATGTGTDNIIIVSGRDSERLVRWIGGHTKMGELIGVAARIAVIKALEKQEGRVLIEKSG
ncbi:MAG: adenosylcobinamide amidohydrolase [Nitrososphaerales archaeon]